MGCQLIGQRPTFILMIFLTTSFFLVEIVVGYTTNSMALVADSFHMLSDIISLFVGFFALKLSRKTDGTLISGNTFGWVRAEVLGALINAVFLVALCLSILISALKRLVDAEPLKKPLLILIVGAIGLVVNLLGMLLFHGHAGGHGHSHGGHGHSHGGHGHGGGDEKKHSHGEKKPKDKGDSETHGSRRKDARRIENVPNEDPKKEGIQQQQQEQQQQQQQRRSVTTLMPVNMCPPPSPSMVRYQERARNMQVILQGEPSTQTSGETSHELVLSEDSPKKSGGQMNMRGVYLHILGDALGSVIVIIAALIVHYVHEEWTLYVDPALSIIMVGIILYSCIPLLKESSQILLQNVPQHIQLNQLETKLLSAFPEIVGIHEFHVWQLAGNKIIASVHVKFHSNTDYNRLSPNLKEFFHSEGIHSTTFQPEVEEEGVGEEGDFKKCLLACESKSCQEKLCCTSVSAEDDDNKGDKSPTADGNEGGESSTGDGNTVDVKIIVEDTSAGCQDNNCFEPDDVTPGADGDGKQGDDSGPPSPYNPLKSIEVAGPRVRFDMEPDIQPV